MLPWVEQSSPPISYTFWCCAKTPSIRKCQEEMFVPGYGFGGFGPRQWRGSCVAAHIIVGRKERKDHKKRPRQDGAPGHIPRYLCLSAQPPFALRHPSICHHVTALVSDDHGLGEISQDPPASPKSIRWQLRSPMKETVGTLHIYKTRSFARS